ncbi:hypothetical protein FB451DRAFT_1193968 [Mycena latifolia]|nr:hypothetical protein FB451DRAFT_1193968 [Mycena latifolia]
MPFIFGAGFIITGKLNGCMYSARSVKVMHCLVEIEGVLTCWAFSGGARFDQVRPGVSKSGEGARAVRALESFSGESKAFAATFFFHDGHFESVIQAEKASRVELDSQTNGQHDLLLSAGNPLVSREGSVPALGLLCKYRCPYDGSGTGESYNLRDVEVVPADKLLVSFIGSFSKVRTARVQAFAEGFTSLPSNYYRYQNELRVVLSLVPGKKSDRTAVRKTPAVAEDSAHNEVHCV